VFGVTVGMLNTILNVFENGATYLGVAIDTCSDHSAAAFMRDTNPAHVTFNV
jgi:hypothetical protein